MKLKLTQPGFETYNGQMGVMFFEDGMSTNDVRSVDAIRMAAVMLCEWEDGRSPSITQSILDNANTPAPSFTNNGDGTDNDKEAVDTADRQAVAANINDVLKTAEWSHEQLAVIADRDGIKGLRAIAEPMDIKGNSIKELITAILKKN